MNSSIGSPELTSSDVSILPPIDNHIDFNHTESTNKSLKRSRSPSLTRDDINETSQSSISTDTPTKKSRKKRSTTDIDQSLGFVHISQCILHIETSIVFIRRHLSADKLHIYRWPTGEPHADLHVLQEQICDYLSLKSFKRKYPGRV